MHRRRRTVIGVLLIAAGVVMLGEQTGWWEPGAVWGLWPLALVAAGIGRGTSSAPGMLWIACGAALLPWTTGLWSFAATLSLLLVLYGIALLRGWSCACHGAAGRNGIHVR